MPCNAAGCRPGSAATCPTRSRSSCWGSSPVDKAYRGRRLGSDLLVDASRRARSAAGIVGARAVVVQAIDERAKAFYGRFGFRAFSDCEPLMLVLRMSELDALLAM